jgi:hypothetical protein
VLQAAGMITLTYQPVVSGAMLQHTHATKATEMRTYAESIDSYLAYACFGILRLVCLHTMLMRAVALLPP